MQGLELQGIDWAGLLRVAHQNGILPQSFWQLTPWELMAVLPTMPGALAGPALAAMMALYPDEPTSQEEPEDGGK